MSGPCRLCGRTRELLPAQIVAEPFYRAFRSLIDSRPSLCEACIDELGEWDEYVAYMLLSCRPPVQGTPAAVYFENVDAVRVRLFALSTLWRASVSGLPSLQHVRLGPFQDWIRDLLRAKDPGEPRDFPITMNIETSRAIAGTFFPSSAMVDGRRLWAFWVGDLVFTVGTDRRLAHHNPYVVGAQPVASGLIAPVLSKMNLPENEGWLRAALEAAKAS